MGTKPVDEWIERLRARVAQAAGVIDAEGVHELRVACGRLSVRQRLSGNEILRHDLRWLRRCAAPSRDADVLATAPELRAFACELELENERARRSLARAARSSRAAGLLRALPLVRAPGGSEARERLEALERRARRAAERLATDADVFDALHRLRRRVRALRYAREWLGEPTHALRAAQDELGAYNDRVVLLRLVERLAVDRADAAETAQRIERELEQRARELCARWSDPRARLGPEGPGAEPSRPE